MKVGEGKNATFKPFIKLYFLLSVNEKEINRNF